MYETPLTGLVLSGGGARAAYQVGVLRAIAQLRREALGPRRGAARSASSAAPRPAPSTPRRWPAMPIASTPRRSAWCRCGRSFRAEQVYRADSLGVIRSGAQWLTMLSMGWLHRPLAPARPRSLLDNAPLTAAASWCRCSGCR
jgi:NTE family protein